MCILCLYHASIYSFFSLSALLKLWKHVKLIVNCELSSEEELITEDSKRTRSSHQRCSVKKGVLRNLAKFTGKHLCQSLCFNIKKEALAKKFFVVNFAKFLRTPVLQNTSGRLLLEDPLNEDPWEGPITEQSKEGPINEDPQELQDHQWLSCLKKHFFGFLVMVYHKAGDGDKCLHENVGPVRPPFYATSRLKLKLSNYSRKR